MRADALQDPYVVALKAEFRRSLASTIDELRARWLDIPTAGPRQVCELYRMLHSLTGLGGTFGAPRLSDAARAAAAWLEPFAERDGVPDPARWPELEPLVEATLDAALEAAHDVANEDASDIARDMASDTARNTDASSSAPIGAPSATTITALASPPRTTSGRPKILLADDTPLARLIATAMLERSGCDVVVAEDGHQALAASQREKFDLILMDVQMPGLDGLVAATAIRRHERGADVRVPIVAVTADADPLDQKRCLDAGMDDCITKPLDREMIVRLLNRYAGSSVNKGH